MAELPKLDVTPFSLEQEKTFKDVAKLSVSRLKGLNKTAGNLYMANAGRFDEILDENVTEKLRIKYPTFTDEMLKERSAKVVAGLKAEPGYQDNWIKKQREKLKLGIESGKYGSLVNDIVPETTAPGPQKVQKFLQKKYPDMSEEWLKARHAAILEAKKGEPGYVSQMDATQDPEQSWKYNKAQSIRQALKKSDLSSDQQAQLILHGMGEWTPEEFDKQGLALDPDVAEVWKEFADKEWIGAPGQDLPAVMGAVPEMLLSPLAPLVSNVAETAVETYQNDPTLKEVPFEKPAEGFDIKDYPGAERVLKNLVGQTDVAKEGLGAFLELAAPPLLLKHGLDGLVELLWDGKLSTKGPGKALAEAITPDIATDVAVGNPAELSEKLARIGLAAPLELLREGARYKGVPLREAALATVKDAIKNPQDLAALLGKTPTMWGQIAGSVGRVQEAFGTPDNDYEPGIISALDKAITAAIPDTFDMDERQQVFRRTTKNTLTAFRQAGREWAEEEMPGAPKAEIEKKADKFMRQLRAEDVSWIQNPAVAMVVSETLADPQNLFPALGVFRLAGRAVRAGRATFPAFKTATNVVGEAGRRATNLLRWAPEYSGGDFGASETAGILRGGIDAATAQVEEAQRLIEALVKKLPTGGSTWKLGQLRDKAKSLIPKLAPENLSLYEHALLFDAASGHAKSLTKLTKEFPHLKVHLKTLEELADLRWKISSIGMRSAQRFDNAGELILAVPRKNYVPASVQQPKLGSDVVRDRYGHLVRAQEPEWELSAFNQSHSQANTANAVKNVRVQWQRELNELRRKGPAYAEMQKTAEVLLPDGKIVHLARPFVEEANAALNGAMAKVQRLDAAIAKGGPDAGTLIKTRDDVLGGMGKMQTRLETERGKLRKVARELKKLKKTTGVEYKTLDIITETDKQLAPKNTLQHVGDVFRRSTMEPGTAWKGKQVTLLPEPVADRIRSLSTVLGHNYRKAGTQAYRDFEMYGRAAGRMALGAVRNTQSTWRASQTLFAPAYYVVNAVGAFGLSTLAHGIKALDPRLQVGAIAGALATSSWFDDALREIPYALKGGQVSSLGEIIDLAKKTGLLDQGAAHMGMHGGLVAGLIRNQKNPLIIVNNAIENYQKLVGFMGFLKGTDLKSVYHAADQTSQFIGNYARMTPFERNYMREGFGFYAWMRFIVPRLVKTAAEDPQRLAAWFRVNQGASNYFSANAPYFSEAFPDYGRGYSFTSPENVPEEYPHEVTIEMMENPAGMALAYVPMVQNILGGTDVQGRSPEDLLGYFATMAWSLVIDQDLFEGGRPMTTSGRMDLLKRMPEKLIARPSRAYNMLKKQFWDEDLKQEALSMDARTTAGRFTLGLDKVFDLGRQEAQSEGGIAETKRPTFSYTHSPAEEVKY